MPRHSVFRRLPESFEPESYSEISIIRWQLLRYCEFLSGSRHDAEDLVQATMLKALPVLKGTKDHPNLTGFLRRIAKNTWLDEVRKREKRQLSDVEGLSGFISVDATDRFRIEEAMRLLVQRLTPQQRAVVLLCDVFQYTAQEAADGLGISCGAVKSALHRARLRLESIAEGSEVASAADEPQKELVEAYVLAFQAADIRKLVDLCQNGVLDPVLATTRVLTFAARQPEMTKGVIHNVVSMVAA